VIRFICIGDIVGKSGRAALEKYLPIAREKYSPDVVLVNAENAAGGFGLTEKIYLQMVEKLEVDCITMGNHWHDKREIFDFFPRSERIVIPANMNNVSSETDGLKILESKSGVRFAVTNFIGQVFMNPDNRPLFAAVDLIYDRIPPSVKIRILDLHAEATSEKQGLAHYMTGKASLVYGTHCHVPTADERIFSEHTGYLTDLGMTGAYDSVIGMDKKAAIERLKDPTCRRRLEPAKNDLWMCFLVADFDEATGACIKINRVRWPAELSD
jgi:hypothetical protein